MKTRMKIWMAVLLGTLMILQVVPGFAAASSASYETMLSDTLEGSSEGYRPALTIDSQIDGTYLLTGQTLTLELPDGYEDVTWTSSNEAVATVSRRGKVTAVGQGTVTITVTDNEAPGISASIMLEVINPSVVYTVKYEVKYPGDAAAVVVSSTETRRPRDITFREKTTPVIGDKPVRHMLWTGDFDVENYRMTGWKLSGSDTVYEQGQKVKISKDTTFIAVFEKKEAVRTQQSLTVNYYNQKGDGTEFYPGKGDWAGRGSIAWLETKDGAVYATFPLTDSRDGSARNSEDDGSGLNYSVNPWYFARSVLGLSDVTEITDEIIAKYREQYKSVVGFRLSEVKGVSGDTLTAYIRANYDSGAESYRDHVFELGEVVTLPYGEDERCYYFEPVQSAGKSAAAEVRVRVDGADYYICQGELTELGMNTVLKQPWPSEGDGPFGAAGQDEQSLYGDPAGFTTPVDPDNRYIARAADVRTVLNKVGMSGENEDGWEVVWFKLAQTRRGFLIEGSLTQRTDRKEIVIVVNGDKQKLTYDGQAHPITYSYDSSAKGFKASRVKMVGEQPARTECGITMGSMTASNFKYEDPNVDAVFVVNNGSVWITPAELTVTADNKKKAADEEDPAFTATCTGLVGDDTAEGITWRAVRADEGNNAPGTYEIVLTGERNQGNYRITYVNGTLEITGEPAEQSVRIRSSLEGMTEIPMNTEVTLRAEVRGYKEGRTIQWWVSTDGTEEGMHEIPGATGETYTYMLNTQTIRWKWRVVVNEEEGR